MAEFDDARTQLAAARAAQASQRDALTAARSALRRAEAAATAARRKLATDDPALERLDGEAAAVSATVKQEAAGLRRARDQVAAAIKTFAAFNDPRRELPRLPDDFPILLFPVRLETRFRTDLARPQLWVRIFPDSCLVDTFEPALADVELASAQRYWRGIWRAGGIEADERGAWRGLVEAHGSGRAGWIVDTYRPANEAARPIKVTAGDVVLVVSLEAALPVAEALAVAAFWRAVWRAAGAAAAVEAARVALTSAVGAARAAQLEALTKPANLDDEPAGGLSRTAVASSVAFVILPPVAVKDQPWSQAPRVELLPDRFVLTAEAGEERIQLLGRPIPSPLIVGPDPFADAADALAPDGENLAMPDELRWMVDFDRAVDDGLGFRVELSPAQAARGFERLTVLGVRMSQDAAGGADELEALLHAHHRGRSGLSLLAQGTPTNNTEDDGSGFTRADDPDASFDDRRDAPLFVTQSDRRLKRDGQWLAELLGIAPRILNDVHNAGGTDQLEARAMQTALWPATLGYFLDTMMEPVVGDADVANARWFFTEYVTGRGPVPALRIGMQPYGILPTTAFSQIDWLSPRGPIGVVGGRLAGPIGGAAGGTAGRPSFLLRLHTMLQRISGDWAAMAAEVPAVGRGRDAHATLLGILGLHPTSVEFQYRYAQSLEHLFNHLNLVGFGDALMVAIRRAQLDLPALDLLARLGHDGEQRPAVLDKYFLGRSGPLAGPLIDDRPLSEADPVRDWTTDGRNYLQWLADAARTSLDAVRLQNGFVDDAPPRALLYLLLRHALMLGYADAGRRLYETADFPTEVVQAMRREPAFVHVADARESESRFAPLYRHEAAITLGEPWTVAAHIAHVLAVAPDTRDLHAQIEAIEALEDVPTARLERVLAEHVDCAGYRFDAWRLGFVNLQLEAMRPLQDRDGDDEPTTRRGVYLGAYGWLEAVRPEARELTPVRLREEDLSTTFEPQAEPVLKHDSANGGFIHAPSLNHAVTAAVLRNGYLANATSDAPQTLAVNLSSERVRLALEMLEGMRQGQSVADLLGYRIERGLHDRHGTIEVDRFIYLLRRAFPLRANKLRATAQEGVAVSAIEARNVVDGLRLVKHVQSTGATTYPFGLTLLPGDASPAQRAALEAEIDRLIDVYDAMGDLALAEGVHQAVQGNAERAAATIQTFTTGQHPPEPDVTRTPATGVTLTHRVVLHLTSGLVTPAVNPTPRSIAEPGVNRWLAGLLPDLGDIGCRVLWRNPVSGVAETLDVALADLRLQPLDVVELVRAREPGSMTELDDRILRRWRALRAPRPDAQPAIEYMTAGGAAFSVFEVGALAAHLKSILVGSRPARPSDAALPNEVDEQADLALAIEPSRITAVKGIADALAVDATTYILALQILVDDQPARRADVVAAIDQLGDDAATLLERGARLGLGQSTWGFIETWRRQRYSELVAQISQRVARLDARLVAFLALVAEYDALPAAAPPDERFALLRRAESTLSPTVLSAPTPLPQTLRAALDGLRDDFEARRDALAAIAGGALPGFSHLLAATAALLPLDDIDSEPFELTGALDAAVSFAGELLGAITSLRDEVRLRAASAAVALAAHAAAADAPARVEALQDAAQALLGEGFMVVPEFTLAAAHGAEWQQALAASTGGALLAHLDTQTEIEFPVDEWLYGAARVRPALRHFEQAVLLAGALGAPEPRLDPIQLPHVPGEGWLALDFPAGQKIAGDRLLYTAVYADPFAPAARHCALLLDEWTEVVPGTEATTGLAFHYDQPSSEAPQAMLLVTPASMDGAWRWDELAGALEETMALAKMRAVEPEQLDDSAYARFLPATVMAATRRGISIATALAINNGVADRLRVDA